MKKKLFVNSMGKKKKKKGKKNYCPNYFMNLKKTKKKSGKHVEWNSRNV